MLPKSEKILRRLASADKVMAAPHSYDAKAHTVEAVISTGASVARTYGTEVLRISSRAVDLSRLHDGAGIPLLDHHKQDGINSVLGRLTSAWFDRDNLIGQFKFNQTEQGKKAEGMVARSEIAGISAGYRVDEWEITDSEGDVVHERNVRWDDDLTFTAIRWQLFEASLVGVPADSASMVRSFGGHNRVIDIKARMAPRARMVARMGRLND
jgi:phage head maturation protease